MGKPGRVNNRSSMNESIAHEKGTRGTETSKYPEEKKETSISLVAASEEERGQTDCLRTVGVADHQREAEDEPNTEGKRDQRG